MLGEKCRNLRFRDFRFFAPYILIRAGLGHLEATQLRQTREREDTLDTLFFDDPRRVR